MGTMVAIINPAQTNLARSSYMLASITIYRPKLAQSVLKKTAWNVVTVLHSNL